MVRVTCLLAVHDILIVGYPPRGKRLNGWCPSNSWYAPLIGCAFAVNGYASAHTATCVQYKQIKTYVNLLLYCQ